MYIYVAEGEFFMVQWERGGNTRSALHLGWHNPSPYCGMKNSPCTTDISNQSVSLSLQVWHVLIFFDLGFQQTVHFNVCNKIKCYIFMAIRPIKRAHWGWVVVMDPHLHGPLHTPWEADKDSWHTWQSMIEALASIYNFISIVPIFLDSSTQNNEKKAKKNSLSGSLLSGHLSAEIFISTGASGVRQPTMTAKISQYQQSASQEASLVMLCKTHISSVLLVETPVLH